MPSTVRHTPRGFFDESAHALGQNAPIALSGLERFAPALLFLADILMWTLALEAALHLVPSELPDKATSIWSFAVLAVTLHLVGGYGRRTDFLSLRYLSEHLLAIAAGAVIAAFFAYVFWEFKQVIRPSRALIPLAVCFFVGPSVYWRRMIGSSVRRMHAAGRLIILGSASDVLRFETEYRKSNLPWGLQSIGLDEAKSLSALDDAADTSVASDLPSRAHCSGIVLACKLAEMPPTVLQRLIRLRCSNVPVMTSEAFHEKFWRRVSVDAVTPEWFFDCDFRLSRGTVFSHMKRLTDLCIATASLAVLSPFLLLFAVCIRLESPGPAIFRQTRVRRQGRLFTMYKFRTMRENAGAIYTAEGDNRVTRLGRILRATRLDELPQLWNVMTGEMSLIGPRAEWIKCAEIYEKSIPNYHLRHLVNPGITGWAQVNYKYGEGEGDAIEKFQYDLYYIRNFSFALDVSIILKTLYVMVFGQGQ